jgi:hypothetical protein
MTTCHVSCRDCSEAPNPPKVWNHLCVDCADDQLQAHRVETGHDPILHIPTEVTMAEIRRDIAAVNRLMGGRAKR